MSHPPTQQEMAVKRHTAYQRFHKRAIVEAWILGGLLLQLRHTMTHPEWKQWLWHTGIMWTPAIRFMRLARSYRLGETDQHANVRAAIAALPGGRKTVPTDWCQRCGWHTPGEETACKQVRMTSKP